MLENLKEQVCRANLQLVAEGLVIHTWGNVSGIDRERGVVVIKPSGVPYDGMQSDHMVAVDLATGKVVEGDLRPSSDTPTHLELYRALATIGGVVHTHSFYATAWAQARREIPPLGTTHADYFCGPVPCTRPLTPDEIRGAYEVNTGKVIVERFAGLAAARATAGLSSRADASITVHAPGVLVAEHGPFAWGRDPADAVHNAVVLEHLARLASETIRVAGCAEPIQPELLQKHFFRKHGAGAYYGQRPERP